MRFVIIILLFSGIGANNVSDGNSIEVPRGRYPFMAFLYYQDAEIRDDNGSNRFFRSAVIIRPSWLLSAAIDPPSKDGKILGFPDKTLLARAGAIFINSQISLNEDNHEQEQEIVELIRPTNHTKSMFWKSDITLLKTVNPFKITLEVAAAPPSPFRTFSPNKECLALMYVKATPTTSEDKGLLQFSVILQKPASKNCGSHFHEPTMICADDSENMQTINYCEGNSGGPLVCENSVVGLQTYINDDCQSPHNYQQLSKWETFIKCGTEEKCSDIRCSNVCKVSNKDKREAKAEAESSEEEASEEKQIPRAVDLTEAITNVRDSEMSTPESSDSDVSTTSPNTEVSDLNEQGGSTTLTKVIEEEIAPEQKVSTASSEPDVEATTPTTTDDGITKVARKSWYEQYKNKEITTSSKSAADSFTAPMPQSTTAVTKVHHRSRQLRRRNSASKMGIIRELLIAVLILLCAV